MGVPEWSGSLLGWENELSSLKERLGPVLAAASFARPAARSLTGPVGDFTQDRLDDVGACGPAGSLADAGTPWPQPPEQDRPRDEIRGYVMERLAARTVCLLSMIPVS